MADDDSIPTVKVRPEGGWECPWCGCRNAITRIGVNTGECDNCGQLVTLPARDGAP